MKKHMFRNCRAGRSARGFSLLEVMIAIAIFTIGLMGVLALFVQASLVAHNSDEELLAKQKVRELMESIYGARNSSILGFASVNNIGTNDTTTGVSVPGIFVVGWSPMYASGNDGIVGTADDSAAGIETVIGADGKTRALAEFERQIVVTPYVQPDGTTAGNLKRLSVSVRYRSGNLQPRVYTLNALISQYK